MKIAKHQLYLDYTMFNYKLVASITAQTGIKNLDYTMFNYKPALFELSEFIFVKFRLHYV